jgi:hypothetical protein
MVFVILQISDRKALCPPDSLDDFIPGTAAPPSPAFTLDRSLSLTAPAFASVEEYDEELLLADDENAQPLISPRTVRDRFPSISLFVAQTCLFSKACGAHATFSSSSQLEALARA